MASPHVKCPPQQTFEKLVLGQLQPDEEDRIAGHLAECERCLSAIESLHVSDILFDAVRSQSTISTTAADPTIAGLIARLQLAGPHSAGIVAPTSQEIAGLLTPARQPGELGWLGPYRALRILGIGGMGVVFEAEDTQLQRRVALKVMRPFLAANASAHQRFVREARAMAALHHDHIVTIFQVAESGGIPFFAMELLHGESLESRLERMGLENQSAGSSVTTNVKNVAHGSLSVAETVRIGREIADALSAAHSKGLIHRDITPRNVWLESNWQSDLAAKEGEPAGQMPKSASFRRVKLLDFGLVRAVEGESDLTQLGALAGTPPYMSPEQARGEPLDERSDLFSLGSVLYRCLTGEPPFQGKSHLSILRAVESYRPRSPRGANPTVPPELSTLVMKLLEKKPAGRPPSARAVADTLAALALRPDRDSSIWKFSRRTIAIALVTLAAVLAIAGLMLRITDRNGTSREIAIQPGDKIEVVEENAATPQSKSKPLADNDKPFVLMRADGSRDVARRITELLIVLKKGGQVEVHGNGPFKLPNFRVDGDLTIRAAAGYRPRFEPSDPTLYWMDVHGNLTIDGCDFRAPWETVIRGDGKRWNIRNCRLLLTGIDFTGSDLSISDSLLTFPIGHAGSGKLQLTNNLCRANFGDNRASSFIGLGKPGTNARLEHNTFITQSPLVDCHLVADDNAEPVHISAVGNLFCFREKGAPIFLGKSAQLPKPVHWDGRDNLYATDQPDANTWVEFNLADWNRSLGKDEPGSRQAADGEVGFAWNDILGSNEKAAIEKLSAIVLQLKQQLGEKFEELGPKWDVVGSGDAYVKALAIPGASIPAAELRPAAPEGGPIVVFRDGRAVGSFITLAQAAAAARSGDEIEIRTDGPLDGCDFAAEKGSISLRAAPGYTPVIEGETRYWNELSLAGLYFRGILNPVSGSAQIRRCANCSFDSNVHIIPSRAGLSEVANCFVSGDLTVTIVPNSELVIRNSLIRSIANADVEADGKAQLRIEHSVLFSPTPVYSNFRTQPTKVTFTIIAQDSLFESGSLSGILDRHVNELRGAGLAGWQGTRNVYRHAPHGLLDELKRNEFSDKDSFELDPMFFDPSLWRLQVTIVGAAPLGFGANVDRVAVPAESVEKKSN